MKQKKSSTVWCRDCGIPFQRADTEMIDVHKRLRRHNSGFAEVQVSGLSSEEIRATLRGELDTPNRKRPNLIRAAGNHDEVQTTSKHRRWTPEERAVVIHQIEADQAGCVSTSGGSRGAPCNPYEAPCPRHACEQRHGSLTDICSHRNFCTCTPKYRTWEIDGELVRHDTADYGVCGHCQKVSRRGNPIRKDTIGMDVPDFNRKIGLAIPDYDDNSAIL